MLLEKEYPATHSMSTAWYLVDEEDNVGIMDFGDNGPVPLGVPAENHISDLILGEGYTHNEAFKEAIRFTPDQLTELLGQPIHSEEEVAYGVAAIQVNPTKWERIQELLHQQGIQRLDCLDATSQTYKIHLPHRREKGAAKRGKTPLEQLLAEGSLLALYSIPYHDLDYDSDETGETFFKSFDTAPVFCYKQPEGLYRASALMHSPMHPVKLSQVAPQYRDYLLRIPHKFRDHTHLQIARYHRCDLCYWDDRQVRAGGCVYSQLPDEDGSRLYALDRAFDYVDRFDACCPPKPEESAYTLAWLVESLTPSMLFITSPRTHTAQQANRERLRPYQKHLAVCCYLAKFYYDAHGAQSESEREQAAHSQMTDIRLLDHLRRGQDYLKTLVKDIRPHVLLLEDEAQAIFEQVFPIHQHRVSFDGEAYPIYLLSELDEYHKTIATLTQRPYRGHEVRLFYTEAEMEALIQEGKAHPLSTQE